MITPDTKNWTWVVGRVCPECSFDASSIPATAVAALVRQNAADWHALAADGLIGPGRPDAQTWSSLEYACHVRDVYRRYLGRIDLMLVEDDPLFPNWDQDASAIEDDYEHQQPDVAVGELIGAAEALADRLDGVEGATWERPGRRSDGASFSLDTISRYMMHDVVHHVADVRRVDTAP